MTLRSRRIIYSVFILAFCIATPLLWLYAAGYQLTGGFRIEKTGILSLDTDPAQALVSLNGAVLRQGWRRFLPGGGGAVATPAKIKNLAPGRYRIRLERDGYWPWEKELDIRPGETTFADDIFLFRRDLPLRIATGGFRTLAPSRDGELVAALGPDARTIFSAVNTIDVTPLSVRATGTDTTVRWSADGDFVLFGRTIHRQRNGIPDRAPIALPLSATVFRWDDRGHDLFFAAAAGLFRFDPDAATTTLVFNGQGIGDLLLRGDSIALLERLPGGTTLAIRDRSSGALRSSLSLPPADYAFVNETEPAYHLLDRAHGLFYVVDPDRGYQPLIDVVRNVRDCVPDGGAILLCHGEFEIWQQDTASGRQTILTRLSEPITAARRHPDNAHVIFATDRTLHSLELDNRDRFQITAMITLDAIASPAVSPDGKAVFFAGRIGSQEGLYRLEIR